MARNDISLKQAVVELQRELAPEECERLARRDDFKQILQQEKNRYRSEVANSPDRTKATKIGILQLAVEKLLAEGEWEKAAKITMEQAKLEGELNADSNINIFAGLTAKDIASEREKVLKQIEADRSDRDTPEILPN